MSGIAVQIEGLVKDFSTGIGGKKLRALDGLSLKVESNQIYGLLGPNGSGKSTTIKLLLGLLRPSTGTSSVCGFKSGSIEARERIGYLPEAPYFYRYLSGRELVNYYARMSGLRGDEKGAQVESVLELVGMREAAERRVGSYSKGMLQRIGLAQALVHDPQLVILDEPTAGVDPMGTVAIAEIIKRLKAEGKTILISSHLLSQMEGLCDRVAILHRGRLMCEGSVSELLNDGSVMNFQVKGLDASKELQVSKFIESLGGSVEGIEPARAQLEGLFKDVLTTDENAEGAGKEDSQ